MSRISDAILSTLLETITDYEQVNLTAKQTEKLETICDAWTDNESIESEINRFLLKNNYEYVSKDFIWKQKDKYSQENPNRTGKTSNMNSLLIEMACEIAEHLTEKDCKHLNIQEIRAEEGAEEGGATRYTEEAQDIFNEHYDEQMDLVYRYANHIVKIDRDEEEADDDVRKCHLCDEPTVNKYCENKTCEVYLRDEKEETEYTL